LHKAAKLGHEAVLKVLLMAKADKYAFVSRNWPVTPMSYGIYGRHLNVVKLLCDFNYDLNYKPSPENALRPLDEACVAGDDPIVRYLLIKRACVALSPLAIFSASLYPKILKRLLKEKADVHVRTSKAENGFPEAQPLHYAARCAPLSSISLLVQASASRTTVDGYGYTPLKHMQIRVKHLQKNHLIQTKEESAYTPCTQCGSAWITFLTIVVFPIPGCPVKRMCRLEGEISGGAYTGISSQKRVFQQKKKRKKAERRFQSIKSSVSDLCCGFQWQSFL
jgi:hypothetical protein